MNRGKTGTKKNSLQECLIILLCLIAATAVGLLFRTLNFPETNIVVAYILSVLLVARFTKGYRYGITAAVGATAAFNYFFTQPYFTLSVDDPSYLVTFFIMAVTSLITSALTSKVLQNTLAAQESETRANAMYQLSNHLTDAKDTAEIASITVHTISQTLSCQAACLCFDEAGEPEQAFIQQKSDTRQVRRSTEERETIRHRIEDLRTAYDVGEEFWDWPIYGSSAILGIIRIPKETAQMMDPAQTRLLHAIIETAALAMDRFRSMQERIRFREETSRERYRANLLRAISHDLRTPLSGIMGTSEMLMRLTEKTDARYDLAKDIYKDAGWLHSMMENILNLTRLQDGKLSLDKSPEAVEEVVGAAVIAAEKRAPEYEISTSIPQDMLLVPMDARLITQVLVNLLDNATKHTPKNKKIEVSVCEDPENNCAVFTVRDEGCGIAEADLPHIFQMFYTTRGKEADAQRGVGLGLAICESIVKAHGGSISARNRRDVSGAELMFTLPMGEMTDGKS